MKLGPFFFDTKELFLILLAGLVWLARYFGWEIPLFDLQKLLLLIVLFLLAKGLLPAIHNENFLILAFFTLFLSFYLVELQLVLFFVITLILFRFLKVI
ncbi:hypothetical protein A2313_02205 [Candidatus Roizmanbacteria bacterium RIFOXYB2_FULL_41_10]|uniref:Uncharacterized protein n=1 Tax=Candidatus Roizmanbacteria bacterium RIFOXYA1_FULL_41_12 TaxID=1802082 RepID=A0A1F7KAU0_9BACT|nr:MAG: hypothetical protein A2262_04285 [Candidatus Roizmanbacteria bacterium RIFOXYA2_FULL_41_8]OGK64968.1 MAG: hypothetical protein A2209_04735 [Candidatus Roizmanbacteria bacterium RIFOXYA1_FULL_41_12]OGK66768.1 MAG: hypothetical protein A2377_02585 [Candidatus Roizmanbacteria bacterium RIFOXYB1_FULL_41_27]OGK70857.1 MAG: hypothetical protein A2403_02120 [Candidatus Roizmanbacteria bacterium RIFOXYC1_FULL_41_16]OGK71896.1 MAG: hypothetical protein A2313_02205 [Candidatus Roizmanbacteria bac